MDKILGLYLYLRGRLAEPSTHAAIQGLLIAAGINIDAGLWHDLIVTASLAFGGLGFFVKEAKPLTDVS